MLFTIHKQYQCICKTNIDPLGTHLYLCPHGNERIKAHDDIIDLFKELATLAGLSPDFRAHFTMDISNRRGDLYIYEPHFTKHDNINELHSDFDAPLIIDAMITHPCGHSNITKRHSNTIKGSSLNGGYNLKINKYKDITKDITFIPCIFETFGQMHPSTVTLIKALCHKAAALSGKHKSTLINFWMNRFSIIILRGEAKLLISRSYRAHQAFRRQHEDSIIPEELQQTDQNSIMNRTTELLDILY